MVVAWSNVCSHVHIPPSDALGDMVRQAKCLCAYWFINIGVHSTISRIYREVYMYICMYMYINYNIAMEYKIVILLEWRTFHTPTITRGLFRGLLKSNLTPQWTSSECKNTSSYQYIHYNISCTTQWTHKFEQKVGFTHRPRDSLTVFTLCWWCHNWLLMTSQTFQVTPQIWHQHVNSDI